MGGFDSIRAGEVGRQRFNEGDGDYADYAESEEEELVDRGGHFGEVYF